MQAVTPSRTIAGLYNTKNLSQIIRMRNSLQNNTFDEPGTGNATKIFDES